MIAASTPASDTLNDAIGPSSRSGCCVYPLTEML
jgi:hypothetical protein